MITDIKIASCKFGIDVDQLFGRHEHRDALVDYLQERSVAPSSDECSCASAIQMEQIAATQQKETAVGKGPEVNRSAGAAASESFSPEELRNFFNRNAERLTDASERLAATDPGLAQRISQARTSLEQVALLLDSPAELDLEDLERRLAVIEEKLLAALLSGASEELLLTLRRDLDTQLAPYRRKMTAEQLSTLERQYTQKRLFENFSLPRLSLFYLT